MAIAWVECWKCELCGHRWIRAAGSDAPRLCAKCRKTGWHTKTGSGEEQTHQTVGVGSRLPEPSNNRRISEPASPTKPDMQALRDICAGKIEAKSSAVKHPQVFYDSQGVTIVEGYVSTWTRNTCGKTWWEDGEQWECLMDKGHREQKHGLRGMVRRLDV